MQRSTIGAAQMVHELTHWSALDSPFYFSNARMTMLAIGEAATLQSAMPFKTVASEVQALLESEKKTPNDNPVAFGVIPFEAHEEVRFVIPRRLKIATNLRPHHLPEVQRAGKVVSTRSIPSAEQYKHAVRKAVSQMRAGSMDKVVLSRALHVQMQDTWSADQLLLPLIKQNPYSYNFCANTSDTAETKFLVGSSPELLVSREGVSVTANPLAGSRKRQDCDQYNQRLTNDLLESEKDLNEHAVVVDAMESVLQKYCKNLYVPMLPSVISTPAMMHLSTLMQGTLNNPSTSVLTLATELHPTPAVCGRSVSAARSFINQSEPFNRGYFTGLVGWCDSRGNGEWVVLIRCGEVKARSLTAYAGAGIVEGSVADDEFLETGNKMRTILSAANVCPTLATQIPEQAPELEVAS